jgi:hypothetical protein
MTVFVDEQTELAMLRAENARLKAQALAKATSKLSVKVKPLGGQDKDGNEFKGNVAVYGLGKYPVTLYPGQWLKLLAIGDEIKTEIELYKDSLSWKE